MEPRYDEADHEGPVLLMGSAMFELLAYSPGCFGGAVECIERSGLTQICGKSTLRAVAD